MIRRSRLLPPLMFLGMLLALATPAVSQTPAAGSARFKEDIDAFRAWDARNSVPADAVLFVGSSTIRLWNSAEAFRSIPVINRGFGGSQISDVNHYIQDVVLKYRPAVIVFYAGDNDVNSGRTTEQVVADYREFVEKVHATRADTRIIFLAIKPSPARWEKWPLMREANARIRAYGESDSGNHSTGLLLYADVASPMLTADGRTQAHLYIEDGLHLSAAGYAMWNEVLAPVLEQARRP